MDLSLSKLQEIIKDRETWLATVHGVAKSWTWLSDSTTNKKFVLLFSCWVVIHIVKGFSVVVEAEVHIFLEFPCFLHDPTNVGNLISGCSAFSKPSLYIWKFLVHVLLKPNLKDLSIILLAYDMSTIVQKKSKIKILAEFCSLWNLQGRILPFSWLQVVALNAWCSLTCQLLPSTLSLSHQDGFLSTVSVFCYYH